MNVKKKLELSGLKTNARELLSSQLVDLNVYKQFTLRIHKNGSRSVEEFTELLSGNIGETPEMDNTEINSETKESESSYSVEVETD